MKIFLGCLYVLGELLGTYLIICGFVILFAIIMQCGSEGTENG